MKLTDLGMNTMTNSLTENRHNVLYCDRRPFGHRWIEPGDAPPPARATMRVLERLEALYSREGMLTS